MKNESDIKLEIISKFLKNNSKRIVKLANSHIDAALQESDSWSSVYEKLEKNSELSRAHKLAFVMFEEYVEKIAILHGLA